MRDKDLYSQILGIKPPWYVEDVNLDMAGGKIDVMVTLQADAVLTCPHCGEASPRYDKRERRWRHLDTCQMHTILVAEVPRIRCATHGVTTIAVPWAESGSGFTAMFEALIIDWLKLTNTEALRHRFGLSWNAVDGIMQRSVQRGLKRREAQTSTRLSVDETSFQKGHEYVTVVSDQESGHVLYVADDRTRKTLENYYTELSAEQRSAIQCVAMDMWPAYINATLEHVPEAEQKIAFDKFHVAKYLGDAVDKVRRQEHKQLKDDAGKSVLTGSKYSWLTNPDNMSSEKWDAFQALVKSKLKTARAWAIKETAMTLWNFVSRGWARKAWMSWLAWAQRSQLKPIREVAKTIKRHLEGIINAIVMNASNAHAESINSRIQKVKAMACGYRNRERFRNAIYFHLGGLDLYPQTAIPTN